MRVSDVVKSWLWKTECRGKKFSGSSIMADTARAKSLVSMFPSLLRELRRDQCVTFFIIHEVGHHVDDTAMGQQMANWESQPYWDHDDKNPYFIL